MPDGDEPVQPDETLLRRVLESRRFYDPSGHPPLASDAFHAEKHDATGISLVRRKYVRDPEDATPANGKRYFIAEISAGVLLKKDIAITPDPDPPANPGHVVIPSLKYDHQRRSAEAERCKRILAEDALVAVHGPFVKDPPYDGETAIPQKLGQ